MTRSYEDSRAKKVAAETAHSVFMETTTLLWIVYRQLLAKPARMFVPDHTRDAWFQLFCDVRTNSPKDRKWLRHHWKAVQPHTANGWLALSASMMLAMSGLAGVLCLTTAILTLALYSLLAVTVLAGVVTGTILTVLSVTMVVAAGMAAAGAASLGWAYTVVEMTHASLNFTNTTILQPTLNWLQTPSVPRQPIHKSAISKPTPEAASLHAVESRPDSNSSTATHFSTGANGRGPGTQAEAANLLPRSIAGDNTSVAYSAPYSAGDVNGGMYPEARGSVQSAGQ